MNKTLSIVGAIAIVLIALTTYFVFSSRHFAQAPAPSATPAASPTVSPVAAPIESFAPVATTAAQLQELNGVVESVMMSTITLQVGEGQVYSFLKADDFEIESDEGQNLSEGDSVTLVYRGELDDAPEAVRVLILIDNTLVE